MSSNFKQMGFTGTTSCLKSLKCLCRVKHNELNFHLSLKSKGLWARSNAGPTFWATGVWGSSASLLWNGTECGTYLALHNLQARESLLLHAAIKTALKKALLIPSMWRVLEFAQNTFERCWNKRAGLGLFILSQRTEVRLDGLIFEGKQNGANRWTHMWLHECTKSTMTLRC